MAPTPLRILFMGTPEFAVPSLQALIDAGKNVVGVISQPDRPKGRGRKLTPPPTKVLAQDAGIPVLQPVKIKTPEFLEELRSFNPDVILVAAYGRILTRDILTLPPHGCINVHGSLLPKYRGAAPVQWAILNGEQEAGVTIMQMDEGLDTGDMLLAGSIPIEPTDTSGTLAPKLAKLGAELLIEVVDALERDALAPKKQNDSLATLAPPLAKEDGIIDWSRSAEQISCKIRGLDPWPTATTTLDGKRLRLFCPTVVKDANGSEPGTICQADKNGLLIATGEDQLCVREIQLEGSRRMPVGAFLQGNSLQAGTVLGTDNSEK